VKFLKSGQCLSILLCGLLAASVACADTGSDNWMTNGGTDVPPYQLSGWFFDPPANPFPNFPDPSQPWTSQANIDQINYWLKIVADMYNDPSLADLGSWNDPNALALAITQAQSESAAPEPMTVSLLGGGLSLLGLYAFRRRTRV
jgi:hypothetical protein